MLLNSKCISEVSTRVWIQHTQMLSIQRIPEFTVQKFYTNLKPL